LQFCTKQPVSQGVKAKASVLILPILAMLLALNACRRDIPYITDPGKLLEFSTDSVLFDTVFTSVGSATRQLKVYNPHKGVLQIDRISIAGNTAEFRLNIDGVPGNEARNLEILPGDSMFIFVEVRINPLNANTPMVVNDSILFSVNGKEQFVELVAWGQDANYIYADTKIQGLPPFKIIARANENTYWNSDKPWVIVGYAVVDSAGALQIGENAKIHFHKNSGLWVYRYGRMDVNGTLDRPVIFQGARLDYAYRNIEGQWDRIWINEGAQSTIRHAIIKNGFIGIQAETLIGRDPGDQSLVQIENTRIENMAAYGIYGVYQHIRAKNLLVSNCNEHLVALTMGGNYSFRHCTFANMGSSAGRQSPSVVINNYNSNQAIPLDSAYFGNCIIYGSIENEISLDAQNGTAFEYWFDHSLIRIDPNTSTADANRYINIVKNPEVSSSNGLQPEVLFEDPANQDYRLRAGCSALDRGASGITQLVPTDLKGVSRQIPADLGCLEK
jgi:hypothetical protein